MHKKFFITNTSSDLIYITIDWLGVKIYNLKVIKIVVPKTNYGGIIMSLGEYFVKVYNDDFHTMEQVVLWLQADLDMCEPLALRKARSIHEDGKSVVYNGEEQKANEIMKSLKKKGLQAEMGRLQESS